MQSETNTLSRTRVKAGNILIYLLGSLLVIMAAAKLAHVPQLASQLAVLGFGGSRLILVGALEVVSALLFMIPAARSFGLLLLTAFLGGAVSAHVAHGEVPFQPVFMIGMIWLAAWLRHPEILWSLSDSSLPAARLAQGSN
jgi:hypothetical protein